MPKDMKAARKDIVDFIHPHMISALPCLFNTEDLSTLKTLLLERYFFCRDASNPDKQRKNIQDFFYEVDILLATSLIKPSVKKSAPLRFSQAQIASIKAFWSYIAIALLQDLRKNTNIHEGGYLRGRSSSSHHDCSLFLSILHRQLFGDNLVEIASNYPETWKSWTFMIQKHFDLLVEDLRNPLLSMQRQLWIQTFDSVLESIKDNDLKRAEKFIYQVFFNIISSFKSVTQTETGYKTFAVPLTLIKANPTPARGEMDMDLFLSLQQLLQTLLHELRHEFSLPPATFVVMTELQTCLGLAKTAETYGSINTDPHIPSTSVSACHSALYRSVPQAMQLEHRDAANDDCCACAIL